MQTTAVNPVPAGPRLTTIKAFAESCAPSGWPTIGALRRLIFDAKTNGLERALVRVGRRVLISPDEFWRWAEGMRADQSKRRRARS